VVTLSALSGQGVGGLMPAVFAIHATWNARVPTGPLNRWLAEMTERHPPPAVRGRRIRLRYITQAKARPPTFALFTTRPGEIPASYLRYLENGLRERFDLPGVPIRLHLRKGKNPYVD
jgi:GTP-binding protein